MSTVTRLLVVDDEESNRDMLGRRLRRHGYEVALAASAQEGLAAIEATRFDLVLLDMQMPDMSGLEMLERLRSERSPVELPVIMVTARTQSEDVVRALDMGANDYVTKPVDLPVALARIRTQVGRRQAEQALADSEERYALAVRGSRDGLWDWKIDTGGVYFSPRWNELVGKGSEAATDTIDRWLDRIHPDDAARVRAEVQEHVAGATANLESEHRVRHEAGHYLWVLVRGTAVRDANGRATRMAGSLTDITEGKVADALTGLPNRVLFMDRLGRLVEYRRRAETFEFALLFLDLDRFKNVNDSLGHHAGDQLLIQASRRLEQGLRSGDSIARVSGDSGPHALGGYTIARMGGDEFALLLTGVRDADEARRVADRIGRLLNDAFEIDGQDVFTSASIGIALSTDGYAEAVDMLRDADIALYRAKASGRSCCEVFDQAMRQHVVERVRLEADLRRALDRHELIVHYQPIVSLATRSVTSVEALVRWRHPERGLIGPREFLHVADETGIIVPLGYWVFEEVCRQLGAWTEANPEAPALNVAVNASARQLAQADFPEQVARIVRRHGVSPASIEIEMTESAMLANLTEMGVVIARLKGLGFRLTIDDFGTGYSAFTYLQRFPVDRIKIDPAFFGCQPGELNTGEGLLQTVVGLAKHLGLELVAEGVETPEQLAHLQRIDCGFGQGFVFLEAVAADPMARLLLAEPGKDSTAAPARSTIAAQEAGDLIGSGSDRRRA
jgi:PAS domain S-box-containing protein